MKRRIGVVRRSVIEFPTVDARYTIPTHPKNELIAFTWVIVIAQIYAMTDQFFVTSSIQDTSPHTLEEAKFAEVSLNVVVVAKVMLWPMVTTAGNITSRLLTYIMAVTTMTSMPTVANYISSIFWPKMERKVRPERTKHSSTCV